MSFSKYSDTIDSRDVIERIEELQDERQDLLSLAEDATNANDSEDKEQAIADARANLETWDDENGDELKILLSLQEDAEGYSEDWRYGSTLVRDSYFTDYAQELAEDIGAIKSDATWPNNCIDWDQAARELQMDYTSVEFDGVTYWVR